MNRFFYGAVLILSATLFSAPALAHAKLEKAEPAVGSTGPAPDEIRLSFTEGLEIKFCSAALAAKSGETVPVKLEAAPDNPKILRIVPTAKLAPGPYAVTWHVVSVDSHKTDGHFSLTVTP